MRAGPSRAPHGAPPRPPAEKKKRLSRLSYSTSNTLLSYKAKPYPRRLDLYQLNFEVSPGPGGRRRSRGVRGDEDEDGRDACTALRGCWYSWMSLSYRMEVVVQISADLYVGRRCVDVAISTKTAARSHTSPGPSHPSVRSGLAPTYHLAMHSFSETILNFLPSNFASAPAYLSYMTDSPLAMPTGRSAPL